MDHIYIVARVVQRVQRERTTHRGQGQEIQTTSAPELKFVGVVKIYYLRHLAQLI